MARPRDLTLLDAIDAIEGVSIEGTMWRVVREGRDPLQGHASGGRWDPGLFDVLYTASSREGAIAEMYFHLSRQPVFPSIPFTLNRVEVLTSRALRFLEFSDLEEIGVCAQTYHGFDYGRTQEIGDAAHFLGFDGLMAPSARWDGLNLVVFCDALLPEHLSLSESSTVDWEERAAHSP